MPQPGVRGRCLVPCDQHRPLSSPGMVRPKPSSYVGCQQLAMAHTPEEVVIVTRALYPCSVVNCCVSFLCCEEVNCEHIGAVCRLWTQSGGQFTLDTQQCHYDRRNVSRNSDKDFSGVESEYTLVKSRKAVISCIMSLWLEMIHLRHLTQRF